MPIVYVKRYTRQQIMNDLESLYVFGDNFKRVGLGGQAKEARGEPNAVGIATKLAPHNGPDAFLNDNMMLVWLTMELKAFVRLHRHLEAGGTVYWPEDGIGTGLANLQANAPKILALIEHLLSILVLVGEREHRLSEGRECQPGPTTSHETKSLQDPA